MGQEAQSHLGNLTPAKGSRKTRIRRGRGYGSGLGKTAGRGGNGQTARTGKGRPLGFEGGEMPLFRRLPKWGFKNPFRKNFDVINLADLDANFQNGDTVDPQKLVELGLLRASFGLLKILGDGAFSKKLTVKAHKFSKSAVQKINSAGGQVEELRMPGSGPKESK